MKVSLFCVCAFAGVWALGCKGSSDGEQPKTDGAGNAECADVVLRPATGSRPAQVGFAPSFAPSVGVALDGSTDIDLTEVAFTACSPNGPATVRKTVKGSQGFLAVQPGEALPIALPCVDVRATTFSKAGLAIASASARIIKGAQQIDGIVRRTVGGALEPVSDATVDVSIEDYTLVAKTDTAGKFALAHVPEGIVWSLSARRMVNGALQRASRDVKTKLDATQPTLSVTLDLAIAPPTADEFEPDDQLTDAALKTPVTVGVGQAHIATSSADVDLVPFEATSGTRYALRVESTSAVIGDFGLAFVDSAGTVKAKANTDPLDYSPNPVLRWTSDVTGRVYARITRNDDEPRAVPYALVVTNEP